MGDNIFKSEFNPLSNIYVVFEDDGITGWAYLCDKNNEKILADCWIYNVNRSSVSSEADNKDSPPPLPNELLVDEPIIFDEIKDVSFKWSDNGDLVYIMINGCIIGCIDLNSLRSYNVNLKGSCPWGEPLKA